MQNIKAHETRKQLFSANASRDNPFQQSAKAITEPPPWSNSSNVSASVQPTQSVLLPITFVHLLNSYAIGFSLQCLLLHLPEALIY